MTGERWAQLKTLFHSALEQPAASRAAWLEAATTDDALRQDVEALLRAHDTAGGFLESPPDLPPPLRIGPYHVERELGRGGMGVVYLAHDSGLNRYVALKTLPPVAAADATLRERLRREAEAAARIHHPAIATVYSLEEVDGELFIASEYVRGDSLRELMRRGPLPIDRALRVALQLADALAAAHAAGIVHRDLKPENILVGAGDAIKVVDFGIAQLEDHAAAPLTGAGGALGTPGYMAPEQMAGLGADARSDIYSAGIVLAEMVTGTHPFSRDAPPLPESVAPVIRRCLAAAPPERYASAAQLRDDLEAVNAPSRPAPSGFWWAFHQAATVVIYGALIFPMWSARELIGGAAGRALFLTALAAAIVASSLRLHRWFTYRWYPGELPHVHRTSRIALAGADFLFAITLFTAGIALSGTHDGLAVLLVAFGVGVAVAFAAIEPATARAVFRDGAAPRHVRP